jgi:SAM-dependent methyltransferase
LTISYDEDYSKTSSFFGDDPEATLVRFLDRLDPSLPVLDIGAGQGRNALFAAGKGYKVDALEPSRKGAGQIMRHATGRNLKLNVIQKGFADHLPEDLPYGGIFVFGLFPDVPWPIIHAVIRKIRSWTAPGSLVWCTGFTTEDPAFPGVSESWQHIGPNSYQAPDGRVRTYLEQDQILSLFESHFVLHHWEGLGPEHRHGDGAPERHGKFEVVLKSP